MEKSCIIVLLIIGVYSHGQITVGLHDGYWLEDMPVGSYIKDTNNELDPFAGIWIWTNEDEKVTFKLRKVVHYLFPCGSYMDYMIGDYSYTKENGLNIVVNTINETMSVDPDDKPMFASDAADEKIEFIFTDVLLNKKSCWAIFEFLPGSTTQMTVKFENPEIMGVVVDPNNPSPPYNYGFTIPQGIVLTKQ